MSKRIVSLMLCLALALTLAMPAYAASDAAFAAAGTLGGLGLFGGVGTNPDGTPNYDLDRAPSRQEAVTMLVRLLGRETEAKNGDWEIPFTDVDNWAKPYVGYAYSAGLTQGVSAARFGGNDTVSATQYLTFILRALGYESGRDFAWNAAWELTDALGITHGEYGAGRTFTRGDVCRVSMAALQAVSRGGSVSLLEKLVDAGAVSADAAEKSGLMPDGKMLLAREIMAAEAEEYVLKADAEGWAQESAWTKLFGSDFDVYTTQTQFTDAPAPEISLREITYTVGRYLDECLDGDYRDFPSLWFPHMYEGRKCTYTWLITNGKGTILGYAYSTGMESEDPSFYVRKFSVDSKPLVEQLCAGYDEKIAQMVKVPCNVRESGKQYIYTFSDIPENAVSVVDVTWNCTTNLDSSRGVRSARKVVQSFLSRGAGSTEGIYPVTSPVTLDAFYTIDEPGYAIRYFVFINAEGDPIGYTTAILSTR